MNAMILSVSDLNTTIDHEPRILDTLLAERLGFARPRDIRKLIERNISEFETYGSSAPRRGVAPRHGGAPVDEYFLNEGQALLACALSRTAKAAEVRKALIEVFMAWRRGEGGRRRVRQVEAAEIRARLAAGEPKTEIARAAGVSRQTIYRMIGRQRGEAPAPGAPAVPVAEGVGLLRLGGEVVVFDANPRGLTGGEAVLVLIDGEISAGVLERAEGRRGWVEAFRSPSRVDFREVGIVGRVLARMEATG